MAKAQQSGTQRKAPPEVLHANGANGIAGAEGAAIAAAQITRAREAVETTGDKLEGVLLLIAAGWSQHKACQAMSAWASTLVDRRARDAAFEARFQAALESQVEYWRDEIIDIVDAEPDPNRARVRVDSRKWLLAKMRPRQYGDKAVVEHSGPDGAAIAHRVEVALVPAAASVVVDVPAQLARSGGDHDGDKAV